MNEILEKLILDCSEFNIKIQSYEESNTPTKLPSARLFDVDKKEIIHVIYKEGQWFCCEIK